MALLLPVVVLLAAQPDAADADRLAVAPPRETVGAWSTDMIDPAGLTRFHLRTSATFADADAAFSGSTTWAYEARAHIRLTRGVALSAVLPVGLSTRGDASGFLGNLALGLTVGGEVHREGDLAVRLGGGFDTYLPNSSADRDGRAAQLDVAASRAYEPQLYLPASLSFRGRFLGELDVGDFTVAAELGLVPTASFAEDAQGFAVLFGAASRVSYRVTSSVEPYLELAATTQIAGDGEIAPPLMLAPGVRFHLAEAFDPALFVALNFVEAHAVMFGIDLASVIRPGVETKRRRALERDDFFAD